MVFLTSHSVCNDEFWLRFSVWKALLSTAFRLSTWKLALAGGCPYQSLATVAFWQWKSGSVCFPLHKKEQ